MTAGELRTLEGGVSTIILPDGSHACASHWPTIVALLKAAYS